MCSIESLDFRLSKINYMEPSIESVTFLLHEFESHVWEPYENVKKSEEYAGVGMETELPI